MRRVGVCALLVCGILCGAVIPGQAADKISVGKAVSEAWTFLPLDIGQRYGVFARYGLDLNIIDFQGDAKLQQAFASNSIAFGLGGGPGMAFAAKGAPAIAIAAYFRAPRNISIIVGADSPIRTPKDLKGKTIGISTAGSLTAWLVQRISITEGWGEDGIKMAALGGVTPGVAAMRAGQVDGVIGSTEGGYMLEEKHEGRNLLATDDYAPVFITHVVFASRALVASDPGLVTRFLQGFFATIEYMRTHKGETDKVAEEVLKYSPAVAEKAYDHEMGGFEDDGVFDPKALALLKRSFVDMGILQSEPENKELFSTQFVPVKLNAEGITPSPRP